MENEQGKPPQWRLVGTSEVPIAPGIAEARERWVNQQVWCFTPWGQWRRGVVQVILDNGLMAVLIYNKGTSGIGVWPGLEYASQLLRLVEVE